MPQHDLVDYLLMARQHGASDLHITARAQPSMRLFGTLQPLTQHADHLVREEMHALIQLVIREEVSEALHGV